jgi:hypothetical protein
VAVFYGRPPDDGSDDLAKIAGADTRVLGIFGTSDQQFPEETVVGCQGEIRGRRVCRGSDVDTKV